MDQFFTRFLPAKWNSQPERTLLMPVANEHLRNNNRDDASYHRA